MLEVENDILEVSNEILTEDATFFKLYSKRYFNKLWCRLRTSG